MRDELSLHAEDHWPEEDVDFDDDEFGEDLEEWPLEEDMRRQLIERASAITIDPLGPDNVRFGVYDLKDPSPALGPH